MNTVYKVSNSKASIEAVNFGGFFKIVVNGSEPMELFSRRDEAVRYADTLARIFSDMTERKFRNFVINNFGDAKIISNSVFLYEDYKNMDDLATELLTFLNKKVIDYATFRRVLDEGAEYFGE